MHPYLSIDLGASHCLDSRLEQDRMMWRSRVAVNGSFYSLKSWLYLTSELLSLPLTFTRMCPLTEAHATSLSGQKRDI